MAQLCRLTMCIKLINFVKIVQGNRPLGAIILVKFHVFSFGAVNPHPWTDQGEIWHEVRSYMPNFTFISATSRPCGAKNPKIGP